MMKGKSFIYYVNTIYFIYAINYMNIVRYNIIILFKLFYFNLFSKINNRPSPSKIAICFGRWNLPVLLGSQNKH